MKKILASLVAILAFGAIASANNYTLDESSIDAQIEAAFETSALDLSSSAVDFQGATVKLGAAPDPLIAAVLSVIPVTSWFGIHRAYLGTSWLAIALNIITGDGFGIVYVVDAVVLVLGCIDNNIAPYVNNPRWLMWANII